MKHKPLMLLSSEGGCAAKIGPTDLAHILEPLVLQDASAQSVISRREDAGFFRLDDNSLMVQSVDVLASVSDDPDRYGAIAAVHSLNDVYAKGAVPISALCILGMPTLHVPLSVGSRILQGAIDKLREAGVKFLGGHTIASGELLFGLSVTGILRGEPVTNNGCHVGDVLVLTKPLGSGISITGLKFLDAGLPTGSFDRQMVEETEQSMLQLGRDTSQAMMRVGVSACTDVSGFGFIGHLCQMLLASGCSARISMANIQVLRGVIDLAGEQIVPAGCDRNLAHWRDACWISESLSPAQIAVLFDPQTAGGLLISVPPDKAPDLIYALAQSGTEKYSIVGQVCASQERTVYVDA